MRCTCCNKTIEQETTGNPYLVYKNLTLCSNCFIGIIPEIYSMADTGDGGLIHLIFKQLLSDKHNRKKKYTIKNYKTVFEKLKYKYNFKCAHCSQSESLTIDHIIPQSRGGSDDINNLQILCKRCNSKKGSKIL